KLKVLETNLRRRSLARTPHPRPSPAWGEGRPVQEESTMPRFHTSYLALAALAGVALAQAQNPSPTGVAATVNGHPIAEVAVQRALKTVPPAKHAEARTEIINFLVDNALIEQHLTAQGVAVDQKEVDARLTEMKQQLEKEKLEYQKVLGDMMLTEQELR